MNWRPILQQLLSTYLIRLQKASIPTHISPQQLSHLRVVPEKLVEGKNGRGNLDYGIESRTTGRTIGLIEVKKDDFKQGCAQATVQMESSLSRKTKNRASTLILK